MPAERITAGADPLSTAATLRRLVPDGASVSAAVAEIIAAVRADGDGALRALTERFDTAGNPARPLRVEDDALDAALDALDPPVRHGLEEALEHVGRVARAALREDTVVRFPDHDVVLRSAPVGRAGIYVPGGRAAYPSTVVMGVVTARAAGVPDIAVAAPPGPDGELPLPVLAACRLAGATRVHRVGGAQAIAALALGTEAVPAVDVIAGPGNLYVQEAKQQLSARVGIDSFAGPSDLVALAAGDADAGVLALDLLAQAEHGAGTLVIAISDDEPLLSRLEAELSGGPDSGGVIRLVEVSGLEAGFALAQALAPEHLQLEGDRAAALASRVTTAGSLFVGTGAAFGDYIAGSNHVLPTGGAARFASALSVAHFRRSFTETRIRRPSALARAAAPLARAEGFEWHARSMEARIEDNRPR